MKEAFIPLGCPEGEDGLFFILIQGFDAPSPQSRDGRGSIFAAALHDPRTRSARETFPVEDTMAKRRKRKYSRSAGSDVESEMRRYKRGTARSGRGGRGGKVKSRKQAIAIGLSKARKKGKRVPKKGS